MQGKEKRGCGVEVWEMFISDRFNSKSKDVSVPSLTCFSWNSILSFLYIFSRFLQPLEVYIDSDTKLTLHGLIQYYVKLAEKEKNRKLTDLLDSLEFNQVVIFVSKTQRAIELNRLLEECNFPTMCIHSKMKQEER